jgi:hypothetical protein
MDRLTLTTLTLASSSSMVQSTNLRIGSFEQFHELEHKLDNLDRDIYGSGLIWHEMRNNGLLCNRCPYMLPYVAKVASFQRSAGLQYTDCLHEDILLSDGAKAIVAVYDVF